MPNSPEDRVLLSKILDSNREKIKELELMNSLILDELYGVLKVPVLVHPIKKD
jgi:hypothetical protein